MRNIDFIHTVTRAAADRWPDVLANLGIDVPNSPRIHAPCPACEGTDRFRFDDNGRGEHICNQCGAGDGLDLVKKVLNIDTYGAAKAIAEVLGIDTQSQQTTSQTRALSEAERESRRQAQSESKANEQAKKRERFTARYRELDTKTVKGTSDYLTNKGLTGFTFPLQPDGNLLIPLVDANGVVTGAQTITPAGEKRLLTDSTKKGSYYLVNAPEIVSTVILAEGLATALSVHLMRPDALTVAAMDAGNLLSVAKVMRNRYPEATIILAGDNDIYEPDDKGKIEPNKGLLDAEKAAIAVSGFVTLPPTEHYCDWDDYRQQNGLETATKAFINSMYQPEEETVNVPPSAIESSKTAHTERDPLMPHVVSRKDGIFWVTPKVDSASGEIINNESWLSSPVEVIGIGWQGKDQFLIMRWLAFGHSTPTTAAIPKDDIGDREGWRELKRGGVDVTSKPNLRFILSDWMLRHGERELWHVVEATGWQCGAYIMPDGEVIGTPENPILFRGRSSAAAGYTVKGSIDSWRDSVARLVDGNYSMMTGIAAAFAAPLIGLTESDGFGIHFYEQSSAGKTTTANVAASLYGNPDLLRLTWYGTALGLANEAAAHNDALMPLDEIGQGADPVEVYKSAYTLFNGSGKLQGAKEGGNRELKRWRTMAISTGEMDMETFVAGAGRKAKAGQLVRLLNIPLSKAIRFHEHQNGKQHADALKDAYQRHYGAAGREWIKYLAEHQQQSIDAVRVAEQRWRELLPADYGDQVHRVGARFAILEAALLISQPFTGWDEQTCKDAIQYSFNAWVKGFGTGNKEHQQITEQTEAFLNAHGLSRFAPFPYSPESLPIRDLAGYRDRGKHDSDPMIFYTFPSTFENEIAKGFNAKLFAKVLAGMGMLKPPSSNRGFQRKSPRIDGRQINVYVIQHMPESNQKDE